jgi:hypothetical protein
MDSKMGAARAVLDADGGEDGWSAYSSALNRRLLRLDQFRTVEPEPPAAAVAKKDQEAAAETEFKTKIV